MTSACQTPKGVDLAHTGLIVGRVIDTAEYPVPGARISDTAAHVAVSDAQGAFSLPLPAGPATLLVSAPNYGEIRVTLNVIAKTKSLVSKDGYIRLKLLKP